MDRTLRVESVSPVSGATNWVESSECGFDAHETFRVDTGDTVRVWACPGEQEPPFAPDYMIQGRVYKISPHHSFVSCGGLLARVPISLPLDTACRIGVSRVSSSVGARVSGRKRRSAS